MLANYLSIAARNLVRRKGYVAIGVVGLATGMACCLLILLLVLDELSYDRFHEHASRIYRAVEVGEHPSATTPGPLGPAMLSELPDVEQAVRFRQSVRQAFRRPEGTGLYHSVLYVDPSVFKVFTLPLDAGDLWDSLSDPSSAVVSREMARAHFGDQDPIGQSLEHETGRTYRVAAVLKSVPGNSHFRFDCLLPYSNVRHQYNMEVWTVNKVHTYVLLKEGADPSKISGTLSSFVEAHGGNARPRQLQPITDIHLHSKLSGELAPNGDIAYVYIYTAAALFVLLIACVNFVNLATALSVTRAKEVSVRKTIGAGRLQLVFQFWTESVILAVASLMLGVAMTELVLPTFGELVGRQLVLVPPGGLPALLGISAVVIGVGILSGGYPGFVLSRVEPWETLKGRFSRSGSRGSFRKALVVCQFGATVVLIVAATTASRQLGFLQQHDPGFRKEQIIVLPIPENVRDRYGQMREELLRDVSISRVCGTAYRIGLGRGFGGIRMRIEGTHKDHEDWPALPVDYDFLATFGIQLVAGRDFSTALESDSRDAYLINEAAVKILDWGTAENALGRRLSRYDDKRRGAVIGVIRDFHFDALHHPVRPFSAHVSVPQGFRWLYVRTSGANIADAVENIRQVWLKVCPDAPFEFAFLDDSIDRLYQTEQKMVRVFRWFSSLAIIIACLGLLGLAAFSAHERTKEIGIRKAVGASSQSILGLLYGELFRLVLLANLIAWPLAFLAMTEWLDTFAFHTKPEVSVFLLAGGVVLAVALLTVSYHALRAARSNPVEALQYE